MQAKDTILSDADIRAAMARALAEGQEYGDDGRPLPERLVATHQAEKTCAIAFEEGFSEATRQSSASSQKHVSTAFEEGRKVGEASGISKGRKEVVEWLTEGEMPKDETSIKVIVLPEGVWQAQLKAWGIEEKP